LNRCASQGAGQQQQGRRRQLQKYFWIALGGSLGSLARFWVGSIVTNRMGTKFPYGTFLINITACVIIGFSLTYLGRRAELSPAWRFLVPVGFVGAYSTFSTFEWETFANLQLGAFMIAALYVVLSILLGLAGVWCGIAIAKAVS
jgi:CrcB protein